MNRLPIFVVATFLLTTTLQAQVVTCDYILKTPVKPVAKIKPPAKRAIVLETEFGESKLLHPGMVDSLTGIVIDRIELVYTQYNQSETFSQPELNFKRLKQLQEKAPYLFSNNLIKWEIVCQTGAKSAEEAKDYFHGFIIHPLSLYSLAEPLTADEEIESIKETCKKCEIKPGDTLKSREGLSCSKVPELDPFVVRDSIIRIPVGKYKGKLLKVNPSTIASLDYFQKKIDKKALMTMLPKTEISDMALIKTPYTKAKKVKVEGSYVPRSKHKREKNIRYSKKSIWNRKQLTEKKAILDTVFITIDTNFVLITRDVPVLDAACMGILTRNTFKEDTVVLRAMEILSKNQPCVVIEDVTGSMSPYIAQTFLWRRKTMEATDLSRFIFFNDGDAKMESEKVIGSIGGVYPIDSRLIDSVEFRAYYAMRQGGGGDCPENNLEAVLDAMKLYPESSIIMIADNNAPIKDISLIDRIDRPVNVILCGVRGGRIQSDYLALVRKVGGSIYTMDEEVKDLASLKEGDAITIGGQKFVIKDGMFVLTW